MARLKFPTIRIWKKRRPSFSSEPETMTLPISMASSRTSNRPLSQSSYLYDDRVELQHRASCAAETVLHAYENKGLVMETEGWMGIPRPSLKTSHQWIKLVPKILHFTSVRFMLRVVWILEERNPSSIFPFKELVWKYADIFVKSAHFGLYRDTAEAETHATFLTWYHFIYDNAWILWWISANSFRCFFISSQVFPKC